MRNNRKLNLIVLLVYVITMLTSVFGATALSAAESEHNVTAQAWQTVRQGYSASGTVSIDSLKDIAALNVSVHFDPSKVIVTGTSNIVSSVVYDSTVKDSFIQYVYVFDPADQSTGADLFNFNYRILDDAELGETYFDIVISDAQDEAQNSIPVNGSRFSFEISKGSYYDFTTVNGTRNITTSIDEVFELSYQLGSNQLASGAVVLHYDPECFQLIEALPGAFLSNKTVDINTNIRGAVYLSFVSTQYNSYGELLRVKFKTVKNADVDSTVKLSVAELYDLELNRITCSTFKTSVRVDYNSSYEEVSTNLTLVPSFDAAANKVTVDVRLDKDSRFGAGDFMLTYDSQYLTYVSAQPVFNSSFVNINDKNAHDGVLKFSVINLEDITTEETLLTFTFDAFVICKDITTDFTLSGSNTTDSMTNPISLNYIDPSLTVPALGHVPTGDWQYDDRMHWRDCLYCDDKADESTHIYTDSSDYDCNECGYERYIAGDVNGDKKVTIVDVLRLAKKLSGWSIDIIDAAADVNGDSKLNIIDALRIAKLVAGWNAESN